MMHRLFFYTLIIVSAALPGSAAAHGTDYRLLENGQTLAAEFFYSDREPMRYAEVLIYSPENDEIEYQNGRTDRMGRFAFCPETPGAWQVKVNDGMGYAVHATVEVRSQEDDAGNGMKAAAGDHNTGITAAPKSFKIVFGLSLLLNIFLATYLWKSNRNR